MRELRLEVGQPSLRRLQKLAGKTTAANGDEVDALPRSTVSTILRGDKVPRSDFVTAFVTACLAHRGWQPSAIAGATEDWLADWRRLAVADPATDTVPHTATGPVEEASGPADTPDSSTAGTYATVPRQLPPGPAVLAGREFDLAVLDLQLQNAEHLAPVSVVSGTAGVGKTALAVWWARHVSDHFPDGQIHLDLRGSQPDPMGLPQALAVLLRGLGLADRDIPADLESQVGRYRSLLAERRALVLLDDALDADQVRPLLPAGPGCLALVTSRNRLSSLVAMEGAQRLPLARLSPEASRTVLSAVIGPERAAGAEAALDEIAELCAHLPLALRIAGANLADRPQEIVSDYARELRTGDRLTALSIPGEETSAVRSAFDASYRTLDREARRLFCRIGLVGCAELTVEDSAVLGGVDTARARRLLNRMAAENLIEPARHGRYAVLDLLRDYARERAGTERVTLPPGLTDDAHVDAHVRSPALLDLRDLVPSLCSPGGYDGGQEPLDGDE